MAGPKETIEQSTQFLQEVRTELRKVHWPTWTETRGATLVVLVVVAILALYLGVVDLALSQLVTFLLESEIG